MTFNTLKYAQMHSTNSNHHSSIYKHSNQHLHLQCAFIHLQGFNLQTFKFPSINQCPKHTPMHLQHKAPKSFSEHENLSRFTPLSTSNQFSNSRTCVNAPITYWNTIELEIRWHKHIHIYKAIWIMFEVKWSPPPSALLFIVFFLLGSYNAYGISWSKYWSNIIIGLHHLWYLVSLTIQS